LTFKNEKLLQETSKFHTFVGKPTQLAMKTISFLIALMCISITIMAQSRPFPQNIDYQNGYKASNISNDDLELVYTTWKDNYLKSCGEEFLRVEFQDAGTTVSEGMGYGMLLTAYYGDREEFDRLWNFTRKMWNKNEVMGWKVTCDDYVHDVYGNTAATDGDLDIAFALLVASVQWGNDYLGDALAYINRMKRVFFEYCPESGRIVQKAGDTHGGCDYGNSSYFMPGYYRVFGEMTGDPFWDEVISDTYELLFLNRDPGTGFNSNEIDHQGNVPASKPEQNKVDYNGCRTPWRLVKDYLWFGKDSAKMMTDKLTDWAYSEGITTLVDGYKPDGTPLPGHTWTKSNPWTGGWASGAMSKNQEVLDEFTAHFKSCNLDDGYYHSSLRALYMFTLSGNFWLPEIDTDTASWFAVAPWKVKEEADSTSFSVEIISNGPWFLMDVPSWIVPDKNSGTGNDTLVCSMLENSMEEIRQDSLLLSSESGKTYIVRLTQGKAVTIENRVEIVEAPSEILQSNPNFKVKVSYATAKSGTVVVDYFGDEVDNDEYDYSTWYGNGSHAVEAGDSGIVELNVTLYSTPPLGDNYFLSATVKDSDSNDLAFNRKGLSVVEIGTRIRVDEKIDSPLIERVGIDHNLRLVELEFVNDFKGKVQVFSLTGRLVYVEELNNASSTDLSFEGYPSGVYLITLLGSDGYDAVKILI